MNLSLPTSLKGAAKALGVFILLATASALVVAGVAAGADMLAPSLGVGAMLRKYIPLRMA